MFYLTYLFIRYVFAPWWKPSYIDLQIWILLVRQHGQRAKSSHIGLNEGVVHYVAVQVDLWYTNRDHPAGENVRYAFSQGHDSDRGSQ